MQWGHKLVEVVPAAQACRDADVVIQDEMLHQFAETDSSSVRADWNWQGKVGHYECVLVQVKLFKLLKVSNISHGDHHQHES